MNDPAADLGVLELDASRQPAASRSDVRNLQEINTAMMSQETRMPEASAMLLDSPVPTHGSVPDPAGEGDDPLLTGVIAPERANASIWLDHTDLVNYFRTNRTPTGIQRVEIELYRAVRRRRPTDTGPRPRACTFDPVRRTWVQLPQAVFDAMCGIAGPDGMDDRPASSMSDVEWATLIIELQTAVARAPTVPFKRYDVLVNVGAAWWIPDYLQYVRHLQHEYGVIYAPFVHDTIPLVVPEMCSADLVAEFREWFAAAMHAANIIFANSRCTARDVVSCANNAGLPVSVPHVVRLDAFTGQLPSPDDAQAASALTRARLGIGAPFALFVATVEARKDHIFVFRAWQRLIETHGPHAVPDLLCVGKSGWLVEFTMNWLRVNPQLQNKVRLLGSVSDEDLTGLYAGAEFCVYNSFYEGWGLPVTESLCHGRVPLIPSHSSLPEAGGPFAVYFEPQSADSFVAQAERLLDPVLRHDLEQRIRTRFRPRSWTAVLEQIIGAASRAPVRTRGDALGVRFEDGEIYSFARRLRDSQPPRSRTGAIKPPGALARFGYGWWLPEEWGVWSRESRAQLLFSISPQRDRRRMLYLLIRSGPMRQNLSYEVGRLKMPEVSLRENQRHLLRVPLDDAVTSTGDVMVAFNASTYGLADFTGGADVRFIGVGVEALAVISLDDIAARQEIIELALQPC